MKWLDQFKNLVWAASVALAALAFMYQAFATKEYVDVKHQGVMEVLTDIRDSVKAIDQRTFELAKHGSHSH